MLIQLQLGHHVVASGHSVDAIWLVDAAVDVQEKLVSLCLATLQAV